ncbi:MAG TPA: copper resistance protein CopD [Caldithrix abyssi]|uniref:Copper resistance protein CopD n=1 Tax=Caldithrix abyssi TaxID=187145 RepID=A0A7V5PNF1_CALAY|nr:copper resistance protein CopD [Caldithrix abyssi]
MYGLLLALHILAATIWTGGHIILSLVILPKAMKNRDLPELMNFEAAYERIGIPALLIQVVTGIMLAYRILPDVSLWFDLSNPIALSITLKLSLLTLTALLALDARFRVIPKLSESNMVGLAWHIIPVTIFAILFVLVGVSFRTGWFV